MASLPPSKRTKMEILEEYGKLLEKYEELKATARLVHDPQSVEALVQAKKHTADHIERSIEELKKDLTGNLDELSSKLLGAVRKFGELEAATEVARKNLGLLHHIEVAAETFEELVAEHEAKKLEFENERARRRREIEDEMAAKKRDWTREAEEHEYRTKTKHQRDEEIYQTTRAKKEQELLDREVNIKTKEVELASLKKQAEEMPREFEKALAAKEQETAKRLKIDFDREMALAKKEWEAARTLFDVKFNNIQERVKRQDAEIGFLREEAERAKGKAQELAIKVIEGGSRITAPKEGVPDEKRQAHSN